MAEKSGSYIKRAVNKVIDLKGSDRNAVKNLKQFVKQDQYKHLGEKLFGKNIPQLFNSIATGLLGYGTMGAIYGF